MNQSILKLLIVLLALHASNLLRSQAPNKINYQGVARNADGTPLANKSLALRLSIIDGSTTGSVVYSEVHSQTTNAFGLYSLGIGTGSVASGSFAAINWGSGDKFLKIEMDPAGGSVFVEMGTSQLLSVPLALYANTATSATNAVNANTATTANALSPSATINQNQISGTGAITGQVLKWDGSKWTPKNDSLGIGGGGDNWGTQSASTDATLSGNGTSSSSLKIAQQGASNGQILKWNSTTWMPANDNTFDGDSSTTNEIQGLSISNDTIYLSKGGGFAKLFNNNTWLKTGTANTLAKLGDNQYTEGALGIGEFDASHPKAALHVLFGGTIVGNSTNIAGNDHSFIVGLNNKTQGLQNVLLGENNYSSGDNVLAGGKSTGVTGNYSFAFGDKDTASGVAAAVFGTNNKAIGNNAFSAGRENQAASYGEMSVGLFSTLYSASSISSSVASDRLFNIGNGTGIANRSDALTVLKNGNVGVGTSNPSSKLHIQGNGIVDQKIYSNDSSALLSLSSQAKANVISGIEFNTVLNNSSKARWRIYKGGQESGLSNSSDLYFMRYSDSGVALGAPLIIKRMENTVDITHAEVDTADFGKLNVIGVMRLNGELCLGTWVVNGSHTIANSGQAVVFTGTTAGQTINLPVITRHGRFIKIANHGTQTVNINPAFTISSGFTANTLAPGASLELVFEVINNVWRKIN